MKLPTSISPNAIAETVVAVYFDTAVPDEAVFGLVYQALKHDFPEVRTLPLAAVPREARGSDPQLAVQPLHQFMGRNLTVGLGTQSITVSHRGSYPGWEVVSKRFHDVFALIVSTGIISKPRRFGLRYISFFPGETFSNLTLKITISDEPVMGAATQFRTVLQDAGCQLLLQVSKDAVLTNEPNCVGTAIDIDTFIANPDTKGNFQEVLASFLETAHIAQKTLFFKMLRQDFLASLNPVYDPE